MRLATDRRAMAMHIGCAPEPMRDHARRRRLVGLAVDQDESARLVIVGVRSVSDWRGRREITEANLVELKALGGELVIVVDVDAVLELCNLRWHSAGADLHQIRAAGQHGV